MRKAFKLFALVAGIATLAVSCEKEADSNIQEPLNLVIRSGAPETKTAIAYDGDKTYTPSWSAGDAIGVFFTNVSGTPTEFVNADAGNVALFEPSAEITSVSGDQTLYAFYPASAYNSAISGKTIRINVKDLQNPDALGTFDKSADILVARPYAGNITTINNDGGIIDLAFARLLSVLKITPVDDATAIDNEYVKSIKIEYNGSGDNDPLTGRVELDLNTGEFGSWTVKTYSASANYGESVFALNGTNAAYLLVNPATIASGKEVTFTVKTNKHDASKTFTLGADMEFPAGNIAKIGLNIDDTWTIEDNTIDPNIIIKVPFTYSGSSAKVFYDSGTHGNLGVMGTSKSSITYTFGDGYEQLRNNTNKISADDGCFYWCMSATGLTIGGINVGANQYFNLSFDRKVPSSTATMTISVSEDGTHFFPITSTNTVSITGTSASTSSFNFSIPSGDRDNLRLKIENSGSGIVIDNLTLTRLDAAGDSNNALSLVVEAVDPTLVVEPSPVNLIAGNTQQLTVTGTNGTIHYSSNDNGVATVSSTGLVTAVAEGTTTISITSDATADYNAGATSVTVNVSACLSFDTVVITETWSADLKNSDGNNAKFVDDGQGIWAIDATYGHKAANNATAASFYSPRFDMSGVSAGSITFAHTGNVTGTDYQSLGKAYYTLDDGSSWTQITLTNPSSNWSWQTATISSVVYAGETIQFRWDFQGNSAKTWEVKDFVITVPEHSITVNGEASPLTVELNGDATKSTKLTIASGYAWSVKSTTGQPANYTYTKDSDTQITVTPAADNTSGSTNTGIGTMVLTDGTVDFSITFDQANKSTSTGTDYSEDFTGITIGGASAYDSDTWSHAASGTSWTGTDVSTELSALSTNGKNIAIKGGGSIVFTGTNGITALSFDYYKPTNAGNMTVTVNNGTKDVYSVTTSIAKKGSGTVDISASDFSADCSGSFTVTISTTTNSLQINTVSWTSAN